MPNFPLEGAIIWLFIMILMITIEFMTMGLTTIWFAGGALIALVAYALGLSLQGQLVVFLTVSIILLLFAAPWARKYFNRTRVETNTMELIGKNGIVTESINNLHETGKVKISGMEWTARALEGSSVIDQGANVKITKIKGVKLIVEPIFQVEQEE